MPMDWWEPWGSNEYGYFNFGDMTVEPDNQWIDELEASFCGVGVKYPKTWLLWGNIHRILKSARARAGSIPFDEKEKVVERLSVIIDEINQVNAQEIIRERKVIRSFREGALERQEYERTCKLMNYNGLVVDTLPDFFLSRTIEGIISAFVLSSQITLNGDAEECSDFIGLCLQGKCFWDRIEHLAKLKDALLPHMVDRIISVQAGKEISGKEIFLCETILLRALLDCISARVALHEYHDTQRIQEAKIIAFRVAIRSLTILAMVGNAIGCLPVDMSNWRLAHLRVLMHEQKTLKFIDTHTFVMRPRCDMEHENRFDCRKTIYMLIDTNRCWIKTLSAIMSNYKVEMNKCGKVFNDFMDDVL